jgi:GNAT superfamily N-acetyltransferase
MPVDPPMHNTSGDEPLHVRPAVPEDAVIIARYNRYLALETERKALSASTVEAGVRALLADPSKGRYFVAVLEDRVIGQMMHTREWSDWRNGDIWWLQSVYVHPDHRGQGVFRALVSTLEAEARATPGVVGLRLYVEEHNERAHLAYDRMGFVRAGYLVREHLFFGDDE